LEVKGKWLHPGKTIEKKGGAFSSRVIKKAVFSGAGKDGREGEKQNIGEQKNKPDLKGK